MAKKQDPTSSSSTSHAMGKPTQNQASNGRASRVPEPTASFDSKALLMALRSLKRGDFRARMPVDDTVMGSAISDAFNEVAELLEKSTIEFARVGKVVGKEGRISQRASLGGASGSWSAWVDSINTMIGDLVQPTEEVARVIGAVAKGDLEQRIPLEIEGTPLKGEFLRIGKTVNTMVDQLASFTSEVTRVAREVGSEGKLGGQAQVQGVAGTWKDLTDSVNSMAGNLTGQVRNIAEVTTSVANGDLSKKITVDVKGEILELKDTINTMVDQLNSFASEVTRVAREVGTEGRLGGQAQVRGVAGVWKDLTDSVNSMAGNLTGQVRNIAEVTTSVANGDLSKKITVDVKGEILELKDTINTMVDQLNSFASEVTRVAREVGTEGRLGGQAQVRGVAGTWKDLTDSVNSMAGNLTAQVRNIAEVTTSVANGDLSKKITVDVKGEILELKDTINTMVDQLNSFASEVTRVAREVGAEGQLGGQAQVGGVAGVWKDLTDSVNSMAGNLTSQVRGIAKVVTAVAKGDLKRKLIVDAKGEIAALSDTINEMTDNLATFAEQVTTVAREVGVEGKLGGQAKVPGAAGTWKGLTENVNQLAANLTTQVRAIAEVATAVTKGDLTRSITVEAQGEVAALKDNINEMIRNLKDTTQKNNEQDWLKTHLARFTRMLQGQRDLLSVTRMILSELAPVVSAQHGAFYLMDRAGSDEVLRLTSTYAYRERRGLKNAFAVGEGLVGQCAYEMERILVSDVPGDYIKVSSGLGEAPPLNLVVLPVIFEGEVKGVIELASFSHFKDIHISLLDQLAETIAIVLNTIKSNMQTEALLSQSQSLAEELQSQQEELRKTNRRLEKQAASLRESEELLKRQQDELKQANEQLEAKAGQLTRQKAQVEGKNHEIELAKLALQDKAQQLSLTSKYKSEFLANMSHELRTPLNSLLILAEMLGENSDGNLSNRQQEFARTIHAAGSDLLSLINDILDMAKIESGTMAIELGEVAFDELRGFVERTFQPVVETKNLAFSIQLDPRLPRVMRTDSKRLQQVLRNLLSNAFKFTFRGRVDLIIEPAGEGWTFDHPDLVQSPEVIAFVVTDTGPGIPADRLQIIFEPFQQADSGTSRTYGGTGLGLSISREFAKLLGGEIQVRSTVGQGSQFTLFLPRDYSSGSQLSQSTGETSILFAPSTRLEPQGLIARNHVSEGQTDLTSEVGEGWITALGEHVVLIVEQDPRFSRLLVEQAKAVGFKTIVTNEGEQALKLAQDLQPDAITLDLRLPDMDGYVLLDRLKHHSQTRHIPVHLISVDDPWHRNARRGAFAYLKKPANRYDLELAFQNIKKFVERSIRTLLIVEDNPVEQNAMIEAVGGDDVQITAVATAQDALAALSVQVFDCVILDLGLPDRNGFELLEQIRAQDRFQDLRIVVYTARELTQTEVARLQSLSETTILKDANSLERLLEKTALFLHRVESKLRPSDREALHHVQNLADSLVGRKVLIVDDDPRNLFALTSKLEAWQIEVRRAETGTEAINLLKNELDVDLVLMDIMMPGIDGYETIKAIRELDQFKELPIIALTAKAMKDDRRKCLDAGASDYLAKPVESDRLGSILRVWLPREDGRSPNQDEPSRDARSLHDQNVRPARQ